MKEEAIHNGDYLNINEEELKNLKMVYKQALEEERGSFTFQGKELLTNYGKYLIEYLETQNISDKEHYTKKHITEILNKISLDDRLRIAFTMNDYENWNNGEYSGDMKLINEHVDSAIRIFDELNKKNDKTNNNISRKIPKSDMKYFKDKKEARLFTHL